MATLDQTIKIILTAVDETGGAFGTAAAGIDALTQKVGAITGPMAAVTDSIIATDAALLALATTMTGVAINAADKFDIGFREISTLVKAPIEDLQEFRGAILDYASTSTQSLDSVVAATYNAISAGVAQEDSLQAVAAAERLAVAGKAELNSTLQGLVGTLNAYGVGLDEAGRYSDVFFTIVRLGKTTIPELNDSLSRVTGTATLGGVPFETLGAAIATVTAAGAPTSEAVTRINAALNAIIKPSSQAATLAAELGIQFDAQALKSKGLEGVLQDVTRATGGSADKMAVLFGSTEALQAVNVLAVTSGQKFRDNLQEMAAAAGATDVAFGKMKDATSTLNSAVQVALVAFGDPLLDSFRGARNATAELVGAFGSAANSGAFVDLQGIIRSFLDDIESAIRQIAANLPAALDGIDWSGISDSMGDLGESFGEMFDGVDLTTVDGLRKAIQAVIDTGETLVRVTSGIVDGLTPFVRGLAGVVQEINSSDAATKEWAGELLGMAKGINTLLPAFGAMGDGLGAIGSGLQALAAVKAASLLTEIGGAAATTAAKLAGSAGLVGAAGAAGYAVGTVLNEGISAVVETATGTNGATLGTWLYDITHASEDMAITAPTVVTGLNRQADATDALSVAASAAVPALDLMSKEEINAALAVEGFAVAVDATAGAATDLAEGNEQLTTSTGRVVNILRDANGNIVGYGDGLSGIATKASEATKKTKEMAKETDEFRIKMEEIASNERIKTIEAKISLDIAALEADQKRVEAAFASIDNSINSTGDLLGSLFGELSGATGLDKYEILDQIERENDLRQQSFELQKQLAEAEISRIEAQVRQMERGDAAIQIDGTGLEPELEAFMWQILKKIRVRANAEFQDYLLGMAA